MSAGLLLVIILLSALLPIPASAAGEITRVAAGQKEVAITLDADAWPGSINTILATLRAHKTKITFFLTGTYMINFPTQTKAIYNAGHEIASHGYKHSDYRNLSNAQLLEQLRLWEQTYTRITGDTTSPYFWRAPYGYTNARIRQTAADAGYTHIYWTLDALDTVGQPKSRAFVRNRVLNTSWVTLDGAIILMHPNSAGTVAALDEILTTLENRGLDVVTVSELMDR